MNEVERKEWTTMLEVLSHNKSQHDDILRLCSFSTGKVTKVSTGSMNNGLRRNQYHIYRARSRIESNGIENSPSTVDGPLCHNNTLAWTWTWRWIVTNFTNSTKKTWQLRALMQRQRNGSDSTGSPCKRIMNGLLCNQRILQQIISTQRQT